MNPAVNAATYPVGPSIHFLNVAYFFQLLYNLIFSGQVPLIGGVGSISDLASTVWLFVTIISYLFCTICIGLIVYFSTRLMQFDEEDAARYGTISEEEAHAQVEHSRWSYIKGLIESTEQTDWRQAIIEADIMLEEMLTKQGYPGSSIGEKLKSANASNFHTLNDAWEAHKVRNEIAHRGSEYQLTDHVAYRTINHYENVFREFNEI
jgi:hypothetical protein